MAKWIRERMRRRKKKTTTGNAGQAQMPPLQPDFMTRELPPREPVSEASGAEAPAQSGAAPPDRDFVPALEERAGGRPQKPASETAEEQALEAGSPPPKTTPVPGPGRRRRRRGRRGRGGRAAAAPLPVALQPAYSEPAGSAPAALAPPPVAAPEAPVVPRSHRAAAAQPRPPKGVVVLAIGLPGSGKSTWFKRRDAVPLSSDVIRSMLFDDVTEQRFQDLVFSTLRSLLRARLVARMPVNYVDATNLSPHDRRGWIKMAHDFGYEVQAVFFDVPTEVCMERNARRNRVVPADVMQRMAGKLRPPKFEEGFSKITVVRVKRAAGEEPAESGPGDAESQEL